MLREEAEEDAVQLAALSMVAAVISCKDRVEAGSAEANMIWGVMGPVLQALAAYSGKPSTKHLTLTKSLTTVTTDFAVTHLAELSRGGAGELTHIGWLLARVCSYPALNVVAATVPFWGACTERQRDLGAAAQGGSLLAEGVEAQMLVGVMACLGRGSMSPLDEEDYVDHDEYRQAVMALRARVLCVVRKLGAISPLQMLTLAKHAFVQALEKLHLTASNAGAAREGAGRAGAGGGAGVGHGGLRLGNVVEDSPDDADGGRLGSGGSGGSEGLTEADMWLKTLDTIVGVLPDPKPLGAGENSARTDGAATGAGGTGAGGDAATRDGSVEVAWQCEKECCSLVEGLLQATPHGVESVTCLMLRAMGLFPQVYLHPYFPQGYICRHMTSPEP
jgi:hypothetical protein